MVSLVELHRHRLLLSRPRQQRQRGTTRALHLWDQSVCVSGRTRRHRRSLRRRRTTSAWEICIIAAHPLRHVVISVAVPPRLVGLKSCVVPMRTITRLRLLIIHQAMVRHNSYHLCKALTHLFVRTFLHHLLRLLHQLSINRRISRRIDAAQDRLEVCTIKPFHQLSRRGREARRKVTHRHFRSQRLRVSRRGLRERQGRWMLMRTMTSLGMRRRSLLQQQQPRLVLQPDRDSRRLRVHNRCYEGSTCIDDGVCLYQCLAGGGKVLFFYFAVFLSKVAFGGGFLQMNSWQGVTVLSVMTVKGGRCYGTMTDV